MPRKQTLTTGDVAAHCSVTYQTAHNWVKGGRIKAFRTPGRHHRIRLRDFEEFLKSHAMPPFEEEPQNTDKVKVLVVDDDPVVVDTIISSFEVEDRYEIASASDGFSAGIQVERFRPNLVILDLVMPLINGFDVCQRIKSENTETMVLVITGYPSDENVEKALECGADGWLAKPFRLRELNARVGALLERRNELIAARS